MKPPTTAAPQYGPPISLALALRVIDRAHQEALAYD